MKGYIRKCFKGLGLAGLVSLLHSCAIYSSSFECPDGRGAKCVMVRDIDRMINNGEIETFQEQKKCRRGKCSNDNSKGSGSEENVPKLQNPHLEREDAEAL